LRDDFEDDLAPHDAARLTENIIQWMKADSRDDRSYPVALRHSFSEENPRALMWTTKELLLLDGVDESLYYDQLREDNRLAPGLEMTGKLVM
jgi:hypothetical protein